MKLSKWAQVLIGIVASFGSVVCEILIFGALISFVLALSMKSCSSYKATEDWKAECKVAPYVMYSTVYYDDTKTYVEEPFSKDKGVYDDKYEAAQIFCIYDSRIYFVYYDFIRNGDSNSENVYDVGVASTAIGDSNDIEYLYNREFRTIGGLWSNSYNSDYENEGIEKPFFYYDGKIVMRDGFTTTEYDVRNKTAAEYDNDEYQMPVYDYKYEVIYDEDYILLESTDGSFSKKIDIEDMARTEYGKILQEIYLRDIENEESWAGHFFHGMNFVNDDMYIIGTLRNPKWGESFAAAFKYDIENDTYYYVLCEHFGDILGSDFYIIEELE